MDSYEVQMIRVPRPSLSDTPPVVPEGWEPFAVTATVVYDVPDYYLWVRRKVVMP